MKTSIRRTFGLAALAGALGLAAAAQAVAQTYPLHRAYSADPAVAVTQARIPLADLDLTSSADARVLLQRIETAADEVCGGGARAMSKAAQADYQACRDQAISGAVTSMRTPALTALLAAPERRAAR